MGGAGRQLHGEFRPEEICPKVGRCESAGRENVFPGARDASSDKPWASGRPACLAGSRPGLFEYPLASCMYFKLIDS